MRKLIVLPLLAVALLLLPAATAATRTVSITNDGFVPNAVTITTGDTITWTNSDTRDRQVASQDAGFASPILKPKETFSFTFRKDGRFTITDPLVKNQRMTVTVTKPAPVGSPTLASNKRTVIYGGSVLLTGKVPTGDAGEKVTLRGETVTPSGTRQATAVTETTTGQDGTYTFTVSPSAQTTYTAAWQVTPTTSTTSEPVTVRVAPRVGLGIVRKVGRYLTFSTKATSAIPYAGRSVYLQRRNAFGEWVSIKRIVLKSSAFATRATVRLPRGYSRLRVVMPQSQAGTGYVAGRSLSRLVRV